MILSIVTLGQSPREDFEIFLRQKNKTRIKQVGILDKTDVKQLKTVTEDDDILVSKLRNGEQVILGKEFVQKEVNKIVKGINETNTDLILIACTGEFTDISSSIPLIYPDKLVGNIVKAIVDKHESIGVLIPDIMQEKSIKSKWSKLGIKTEVFDISPYVYSETDLLEITKKINESKLNFIICDCMGYNVPLKEYLMKNTNKTIVLSSEIVFNAILSIS